MRSALLAVCALVVAAPAWAQEPLDPKDAETFRAMAEQLERMKIIRCEGSSGLGEYYAFWKGDDGSMTPMVDWPSSEEVLIWKDRTTFVTATSVLVITPTERIKIRGDRIERDPCQEMSEELTWFFSALGRPSN